MTARTHNPATVLPDSMKGIQSVIKAAHGAGVDRSTMELVHQEVSNEVAKHCDEMPLAGLVLWIARTNPFNRLNATTKQPAGAAR